MKQMPTHSHPYKPLVHVHLLKSNHQSGKSKQYCQDYLPNIDLCHTLVTHVYFSKCHLLVERRQVFPLNYLHSPDARQLCKVQRLIWLKEESDKIIFSFLMFLTSLFPVKTIH